MANPEISVLITAKETVSAALKAMEKQAQTTSTNVSNSSNLMSDGFKKLGETVAEVFAAQKILTFVKDSIRAFDDESVAVARLRDRFGEHAEALVELGEAQSKVTRFSKDEFLAAEQTLGMHKLNSDQIKKLIPVIEDYAAKSGHGLVETANAFSYAIEYGSTRSLRQFGVEIEKNGSQQSIFNDLLSLGGKNAGQFAEQLGKTGTGAATILGHEINEIMVDIGKIVVDSAAWNTTMSALVKSAEATKGFLDWIAGKTEKEQEKNQADLETLNRRIKMQQELLAITNSIKFAEKEGGNVTFKDLAGNDMSVTLERAKQLQTQLQGWIGASKKEAAPPEKSALGTTPILGGKDTKDKSADEYATAQLDAQKYLSESIIGMQEDSTAKELMQEDKKYKELKAKLKTNTTEMANLEKGHLNNVASIMKKAYEKEVDDTVKKDNDEMKGNRKKLEDDKKIAADEKELNDAKRNMMFSIGEDSIAVMQDIAKASKAGAREQAALAGSMAVVQAAQAIMNIWATQSAIPDPLGTAFKISEIAVVTADTSLQIAKISGAKFAFGGIVPGNPASGDSVMARLTPGERVLTAQQQSKMSSNVHYHIDNSTTIHGSVDPRAVRDFNRSKAQQTRDLIANLRYAKLTGQNIGTFA
jgi:hypothetical protein